MKKVLIFIAILFVIFIFKEDEKYVTIPDTAIRYRIIPHSNSATDQNAKEKIQDKVEETLSSIMDSASIEETRIKIVDNIDNIEKDIETVKKEINYDKDIKVLYGINYFPEKEYKGVLYEEGYYESLVVEIGDAKGDNFWCVLFPPLCMLEASEETEDVEYKFAIKELIDKFIN